jgi:hypothetical protein
MNPLRNAIGLEKQHLAFTWTMSRRTVVPWTKGLIERHRYKTEELS